MIQEDWTKTQTEHPCKCPEWGCGTPAKCEEDRDITVVFSNRARFVAEAEVKLDLEGEGGVGPQDGWG